MKNIRLLNLLAKRNALIVKQKLLIANKSSLMTLMESNNTHNIKYLESDLSKTKVRLNIHIGVNFLYTALFLMMMISG
jgi:hypothetical protein